MNKIIKYEDMVEGIFIDRPNRFIANCKVDGKIVEAHVKNTGRCKELLIEGAKIYLQENDNPKRRTKYSLIAVLKDDLLINMDSQVPNKVVEKALKAKRLLLPGLDGEIRKLKAEVTYKNSRFDFYFETDKEKGFIEVKGVTLEENRLAKFPDAPTERGLKHLNELIQARENGYKAYVIFVIQMTNVDYFEANWVTHKEFGQALVQAKKSGVKILAYDSIVTEDSIKLNKSIKVRGLK